MAEKEGERERTIIILIRYYKTVQKVIFRTCHINIYISRGALSIFFIIANNFSSFFTKHVS